MLTKSLAAFWFGPENLSKAKSETNQLIHLDGISRPLNVQTVAGLLLTVLSVHGDKE